MLQRLASALLALTAAATLHAQSSAPVPTPQTVVTPTLAAPSKPDPLAADSAKDKSLPPLTLDQCVTMALDKNFDLRIQRIDTAASVNNLEITKAEYDPTLSADISHGYSRTDPNAQGGISSGQTTSASAGISQKVITGATLQVGYSADLINSRARPDDYGSGLSLSVRQPILKNFGSTVNKAAIERARLGVDRSNYDLKATVLSTIRAVEAAYYNLAFVRARLEVRRFSLQVAQKLLEENKVRQSTGVATSLDVLQAEVGVATARRDILVAEKAVNDAEDSLLALINPFQFQAAIGPIQLNDLGSIDPSFAHSYKLARENSPDIASMRLAVKQYEIDLAVAKRNRLPQLDVVGSAGYGASRSTFGSAVAHTMDNDNHDWSIGATITYPWGQRRDKANLALARASLDTVRVSLDQLDQNILVQVRTAVRGVETSEEGVRITTLATQLSEKQYELEKARYDQGLSTFRRVQESQEDWDNARIAELDARVSLRNALADLARLEGTSLPRYGVKLDEAK